MRDTKYRVENLALYDYKRVEQHLSAMAAKGWRLESIGARLWKYRRAEPAKVHYAVAYIQDASQFNPGPTERQQTLEELCAAAGRLTKNGGRFALCHRPERLTDVLCALRAHNLEPKRLRLVSHRPGYPPSLLLVEAVRQGRPGLSIETAVNL